MSDALILGLAGYVALVVVIGIIVGNVLRERSPDPIPPPARVDFEEMGHRLDAVIFDWPIRERPVLHVLPGGRDDGDVA